LYVLSQFKTSAQPKIYNFISGGAGVGKSVLINAIYQSLSRHFTSIPGHNCEEENILLTAFTGKAAFNINGMTLHTTFGLPVNQCGARMVRLDEGTANTYRTKLNGLKLIITDEISMVGGTIFKYLDERLKQIFQSQELFAGISIIAVGDFNQLPPVGDSMIFQPSKKDEYEVLAGAYRWTNFKIYELTEIMRQKNDLKFANALNNLANDCLTKENINLFQQRCSNDEAILPINAIHLFATNNDVDKYNFKILENLKTEGCFSVAKDKCSSDTLKSSREKALHVIKSYSKNKTYGLPLEVNLKISAKYMMTANVNVEDGLVNGATGTLNKISYTNNLLTNCPIRLWILFDDKRVGINARAKWKSYCIKNGIDINLTPLDKLSRNIKIGRKSNLINVTRKQFLIVPSSAITIHKSQGDTYDKVVVHMGKRAISKRMLYVAMSRAKTADGLFIVSNNFTIPKPLKDNDPVTVEMKRLRENNLLKLEKHIPDVTKNMFSFVFHNCQSYNSHFEQIIKYTNLFKFDLIFLCETLHKNIIAIPNFNIINHMPQSEGRGMIVAKRDTVGNKVISTEKQIISLDKNKYCEGISFLIELNSYMNIKLIMIYKSPSCHKNAIESILNKFNVKANENVNLQLIGPSQSSTNLGTHIDLCFSNIKNIGVKYFESIFSYHKPLNIYIK
jgi:nucleoside-triphosphatase THEP1